MGHPEVFQGDLENQPVLTSCEVLTKARGNVQPLSLKTKVRENKILCESNAKVRGNIQPR
jgi:hypothetical protein